MTFEYRGEESRPSLIPELFRELIVVCYIIMEESGTYVLLRRKHFNLGG